MSESWFNLVELGFDIIFYVSNFLLIFVHSILNIKYKMK